MQKICLDMATLCPHMFLIYLNDQSIAEICNHAWKAVEGFLKEQFPFILFNQTICILNFFLVLFFQDKLYPCCGGKCNFYNIILTPSSLPRESSWENNVSSNIKFLSVLALEIDISNTRKSSLLFSFLFNPPKAVSFNGALPSWMT